MLAWERNAIDGHLCAQTARIPVGILIASGLLEDPGSAMIFIVQGKSNDALDLSFADNGVHPAGLFA